MGRPAAVLVFIVLVLHTALLIVGMWSDERQRRLGHWHGVVAANMDEHEEIGFIQHWKHTIMKTCHQDSAWKAGDWLPIAVRSRSVVPGSSAQ